MKLVSFIIVSLLCLSLYACERDPVGAARKSQNAERPISTLTISAIPRLCAITVKILTEQPITKPYVYQNLQSKRVHVPRYAFCLLVEKITPRVQNPDQLELCAFNSHHNGGGCGIELCVQDQHNEHDFKKLEQEYSQIITALSTGWKFANPQKYPDMLFHKDPQSYHLLMKQGNEHDATIIRHLGACLGIDASNCFGYWRPSRNLMYWWIEKDEDTFNEIRDAFELVNIQTENPEESQKATE